MRKIFALTALFAATLALGACLRKETTHTLYLSPDGAVVWWTLEDNVHSDATGVDERAAEESAYFARAAAGSGDIAGGLAALEPTRVQTRVLRHERPFTVLTEAWFPRAESLANAIIAAFRIPGDAYLTHDEAAVTLHIHLDFRGADEDDDNATPVVNLIDPLSTYRIVLTDGQFVAASGFAIDESGTIARPVPARDDGVGQVLDLSLTWVR